MKSLQLNTMVQTVPLDKSYLTHREILEHCLKVVEAISDILLVHL